MSKEDRPRSALIYPGMGPGLGYDDSGDGDLPTGFMLSKWERREDTGFYHMGSSLAMANVRGIRYSQWRKHPCHPHHAHPY